MTFSVDDLEKLPKTSVEKTPVEFRIHRAIVDHVRGNIRRGNEITRTTAPFTGLFITHIYAGRSKEEGFFLKMLGVVSGVPDLLAIWPDKVRGYDFGFIEVKTPIGQLSPPQRKFQGFCSHLGINWGIARSVDDAHKLFIKWGLQPVHNNIREADIRSDTQKKKDIFEMYKPNP